MKILLLICLICLSAREIRCEPVDPRVEAARLTAEADRLNTPDASAETQAAIVEKYRRANTLLPVASTLYDQAVLQQRLGRFSDALDALNEILRRWPVARLEAEDPGSERRIRGRITDLTLLARLNPPLTVTSEPAGAVVTIVSEQRKLSPGKTPIARIDVPVGRYGLTVRLPGHLEVAESIDMVEGRPLIRAFKLVSEASLGTVRVNVPEAGLAVRLDATDLGTAPVMRAVRLPAGRHVLRVTEASGQWRETTFELKPGVTLPVGTPPSVMSAATAPEPLVPPVVAWSAVGVGAAAVVTGAILMGVSYSDEDALDTEIDRAHAAYEAGDADGYRTHVRKANALNGDFSTYRNVGLGVGVAGLVTAAAGAALVLMSPGGSF